MIKCKPLHATFYYCIECDRITAFDGNCHCFLCGCDCPTGELNDYSISKKEWDDDYLRNYEVIGNINDLPQGHWLLTI